MGQSRKDVESLIGQPDASDRVSFGHSTIIRAFYEVYELRVDYDKHDTIEFIEFIYGPFPKRIQLSLYGIDPFRKEADDLIEILSSHNSGKVDESEAPNCYAFENISMGIWRQSTPAVVQEEIERKKAANRYEVNKKWLEEELEKSKHFWTIGIGRQGYYSS